MSDPSLRPLVVPAWCDARGRWFPVDIGEVPVRGVRGGITFENVSVQGCPYCGPQRLHSVLDGVYAFTAQAVTELQGLPRSRLDDLTEQVESLAAKAASGEEVEPTRHPLLRRLLAAAEPKNSLDVVAYMTLLLGVIKWVAENPGRVVDAAVVLREVAEALAGTA